MIIDSTVLSDLLQNALMNKTTWLEASTHFTVEDYIDTFRSMRATMERTLNDLANTEADYSSPAHSIWSISETITHLVYSQGFYFNQLLENATTQIPHVLEAAKGFGEGARPHIFAEELRRVLHQATEDINLAIEDTRHTYDPDKINFNPLFGQCNYRTWLLLLLGHETDHLRQSIIMRRVARKELQK
jgi:uncharacterized damage-inducible protein DinB